MIRTLAAITTLTTIVSAQVRTPFDAPVVQADLVSRFVKTLDLDNDGWTDAISAFFTNASSPNGPYFIAGYYNDQTGKLTRGAWSLSVPSTTNTYTVNFDQHDAWAVSDLNGDGKQDFVFATTTTCYVYLSNGTLAPTQAIAQAIGTNPTGGSVALADFDGDGDVDLAMNHAATIEIYDIDLVNGALVSRSTVLCPSWVLGRLVAAELTGDATPDLFASGKYVIPVQNGILGSPIAFSDVITPAIAYEHRNDVGDIDGDGDVDAITFIKGNAPGILRGYRVLRRISPTQFVAEPLVPSGGPARDLFDVDGDGDLDAVCCGGGGGGSFINVGISTLRIALNDGLGNFADSIDVPNLGSSAIGGVVDMDHDGRVDFVAGRAIYYQRRPLVGPLVQVVGTDNQSPRTVADFDGDGDVDFDLMPWSVTRNRGDGGVTTEPVAIPAAPAGLTLTGQGHHGDWDGDGDEDNLMLGFGPGGFAGLVLLRQQGNGVFVNGGLVSGPTGLGNFNTYINDGMAADVDQDGDQDLILRTFNGPFGGVTRSAWWRNDGAAGFVYQTTMTNFIALQVLDFDGDGISDWIGSIGGSGQGIVILGWARGLGGATWALPVTLGSTEACADFGFGDFDADGDLDIVDVRFASTGGIRQPRLRWNQGDGSFVFETLPLELSTNGFLNHVNVLDVDGDGRADFVVGPVKDSENTAGVYLRKGDNSGFESPIVQVLSAAALPNTFTRGVPADVDGDGDLDYIWHNRCFDNLTFDGASAGSRLQHDNGFAGTGGIRPLLGAKGPFRVGQVAHVTLRGAKPGDRAFLVWITSSALPLPTLPGTIISRPPYDPRIVRLNTSGVFGGEPGSGSFDIGFWVSPSLAGLTRHYTALVTDPATHGHRSISNMLTITFAP